ncbi:hypothetical protein BN871_BW_00270 [Paenibacillus sp. P22]|nr:hypothetical protein BN871_BW_00270 [Paenibacillus sp. P22]
MRLKSARLAAAKKHPRRVLFSWRFLFCVVAAVDRELDAGDVRGFVGSEKQDALSDVLRLAEARQRSLHQEPLNHLLVLHQIDGHRRFNVARVNGVGANVVLRVIDGCRFRQHAHGAFAGGVRAGAAAACQAGDGGDVHNGSAASFDHMRDDVFLTEEDARHIDRHRALPALDGLIQEWNGVGDAGIVDENINLSELGDRRVDDGYPVLFGGNIMLEANRFSAERFDFLHDFLDFFFLEVGDDDLGAFFGEQKGVRFAHAACRACNDGYFAFESVHICILPVGFLGFSNSLLQVGNHFLVGMDQKIQLLRRKLRPQAIGQLQKSIYQPLLGGAPGFRDAKMHMPPILFADDPLDVAFVHELPAQVRNGRRGHAQLGRQLGGGSAALVSERLQDGVLRGRHVGILQLGVAVDNGLHMETDQLGQSVLLFQRTSPQAYWLRSFNG